MEIEKKFLLSGLPEYFDRYEKLEMEQGYLITQGCTLRIRRANDCCFLTLKQKDPSKAVAGIIINEEVESEIPRASYEALKQLVKGGFISKTRTLIPYLNHTIEVDEFHGDLQGLIFAEIEYTDADDALHLPIPTWFSKDVSNDRRFRNTNLSEMDEEEIEAFLDEIGKIALVIEE
ncbi:MAG: adenylate cyclase [Lachnospiraceae bacterium]|nr:adenylate cyclase [Lachnospiraceae bacterium]